jgi:hypothetical protein
VTAELTDRRNTVADETEGVGSMAKRKEATGGRTITVWVVDPQNEQNTYPITVKLADLPTRRGSHRPGGSVSLSDETKGRVAAATVRLTGTGGQGVLVTGGFVLTAAHCINWDGRGGMALGDHYLEPVRARDRTQFRLSPLAVEPVADMAVLGAPDNQVFPDDDDAFQEWCERTAAVPLSTRTLDVDESLGVHIRTHQGKWITGTLTRHGIPNTPPSGVVWLEADSPVRSGTSGGPVVDGAGRLVGVISWSGEGGSGKCQGMIPVAHLALPRWVVDQIAAAQGVGD